MSQGCFLNPFDLYYRSIRDTVLHRFVKLLVPSYVMVTSMADDPVDVVVFGLCWEKV